MGAFGESEDSRLRGYEEGQKGGGGVSSPPPAQLLQVEFDVEMACGGCSGAVSRTLRKVAGVKSVDCDLAKQRVLVLVDPSSMSAVKNSLEKRTGDDESKPSEKGSSAGDKTDDASHTEAVSSASITSSSSPFTAADVANVEKTLLEKLSKWAASKKKVELRGSSVVGNEQTLGGGPPTVSP